MKRSRKARATVISSPREEPADKAALEARARVYGLTPEQAKDQRAGTAIGRLAITGRLTDEQYEGLRRLQDLHADYQSAIAAPGQPKRPKEAAGTLDDDGHAEWCASVRRRYRDAMNDLTDAEAVGRKALRYAFTMWVLNDTPDERCFAELQMAANVLSTHFMRERKRAA